jgi:preprotein translocase subunit YajC
MNLLLLLVEHAGAAAGAAQTAPKTIPTGGGMSGLLMIIVFFVIFYIILIIPQQRKAKKDEKMRTGTKENDRILTNGGILATVTRIKEKSLIVTTGKGKVEIEILKNAVAQNITQLEAIAREKANKK